MVFCILQTTKEYFRLIHKKYDHYRLAAEEMFERTESEWAPWTIVEATDRWFARRKIFETIIRALEQKVGS